MYVHVHVLVHVGLSGLVMSVVIHPWPEEVGG